jgi:hypothetical protein
VFNYRYLEFINSKFTTKTVLNELTYKKEDTYKVYTKIIFHCSNINADSPLSSKQVKL